MDAMAIVAVIGGAILINELSELSPFLARRLVLLAARWWTGTDDAKAAIYAEEWSAVINDRPGKLLKLFTAVAFAASGLLKAIRRTLVPNPRRLAGDARVDARKGRNSSPRILIEIALLVGVSVTTNIATSAVSLSDFQMVSVWALTGGLVILLVGVEIRRTIKVDPTTADLVPYLRGQLRVDLAADGMGIQNSARWEILNAGVGQSVVILGTAGAGKTTLLRQIAAEVLTADQGASSAPAPVILSLHDWDPLAVAIEDWIASTLRRAYNVDTASVRSALSNGQLTLLLDAFDELPRSTWERAAQQISALGAGPSKAGVILTCRSDAFPEVANDFKGFAVVELTPFAAADLFGQIRRVPGSAHGNTISFLETAIRENPELNEVLLNGAIMQVLPAVLSEGEAFSDGGDKRQRSTALMLRLGSQLWSVGNMLGAEQAFRAATESTDDLGLSALGSIFLGSALQSQGEEESAAKEYALALEKIRTLGPRSMSHGAAARPLSEVERQVLAPLRRGVTYDLGQISSRALLSPSETQEALAMLERKGIVLSDAGAHGTRWKVSAYSSVGGDE
jgi:hypothetical protein